MSDLNRGYVDHYSINQALEQYKQGQKLSQGSEKQKGEQMMKEAKQKLDECGYNRPLPS